ncbi:MAG: tryptophan--tRNA ligase, partial [Desulfovibrio sp.]|nr:tryptophan--tRNA ligase [Desulfovibrio sp.]
LGCVQCKKIFLKNLHSLLDPLQERRKTVSDEVARDILLAGNEKARAFARGTMEDVRRLVKIF